MELLGSILIILFTMPAGFMIQYYIRLSPWTNLMISVPLVLLIPPLWAFGLVCGVWICCAFNTFHPETANKIDAPNRIGFGNILLYSGLTFLGFLLTLILLWKFKTVSNLSSTQREIFAWIFLAVIEICLYKIIARLTPGLYRIPLGYAMAVINFLMIFYWISTKGIYLTLLVFFTLLILNPLILTWLEPVIRQGEPYSWRK